MDDTIDLSKFDTEIGRLPRNENVTDIWDMEHDQKFLKRKLDVAQHVLAIEDPGLLDEIYSMLQAVHDDIPAQHLASLKCGIADADAGRVISAEEFMKELNEL